MVKTLRCRTNGVRLSRALQGYAAAIADGIRDEELRSHQGVENIDNACKGFIQIQKGGNFEKVFYDSPWRSDEQFVANCSRKVTEFGRL